MKKPNFRKYDLENWARKEHYHYYTEILPISYSLTAPVDVSRALSVCREKSVKFYAYVIAAATKIVNELEFLRMFQNEEGELCVWEKINPNYTLFHKDDKTFSDCWSEAVEDPMAFCRVIEEDLETYGDVKGIKARDGQPPNFFCISMVPWIAFTGYATASSHASAKFFPVIACGKYEEKQDGSVVMPVTFTISHAVCDGYHASLFYEGLQKNLDSLLK